MRALYWCRLQAHHFWRFWTAPLTDKPDYDLSLTRLLAIGFFIVVAHAIEEKHDISAAEVTMTIVVMAAAFGKATFTFFLARQETKLNATSTTNVAITDTTTRTIEERRDATRGVEPAP